MFMLGNEAIPPLSLPDDFIGNPSICHYGQAEKCFINAKGLLLIFIFTFPSIIEKVNGIEH